MKKYSFITLVLTALVLLITVSGCKKYLDVNNAVELIINIVREKKGKIVFVDNGELKDFNGIALKLRYSNSLN